MSASQIRVDGKFFVSDLDDGAYLHAPSSLTANSTVTWDLSTLGDLNSPVMNLFIDGALPVNVTINTPSNAPRGAVGSLYFMNPGTNTPNFQAASFNTGFHRFCELPTFDGSDVLYQIKQIQYAGAIRRWVITGALEVT